MIRPAIEADLPELYAIYTRSLAASSHPCGAVWNKAHFQSEWEAGKAWVGDEQGRPHSFIFCRHNGEAWEITQLATDPSFWRRGYMVDLLAAIFLELKAPFWLEVHEANQPACRLYEKQGFKKVGRRPSYYLDGGAALLYSKT